MDRPGRQWTPAPKPQPGHLPASPPAPLPSWTLACRLPNRPSPAAPLPFCSRHRPASPTPIPACSLPHPSLQLDVLAEVEGPSEVVLDTRDLKIHSVHLIPTPAAGAAAASPSDLAFRLAEPHKASGRAYRSSSAAVPPCRQPTCW